MATGAGLPGRCAGLGRRCILKLELPAGKLAWWANEAQGETNATLCHRGQTLGGEQLSAKLAECMRAGPCRFYLVAPVTQTEASDQWAAHGSTAG